MTVRKYLKFEISISILKYFRTVKQKNNNFFNSVSGRIYCAPICLQFYLTFGRIKMCPNHSRNLPKKFRCFFEKFKIRQFYSEIIWPLKNWLTLLSSTLEPYKEPTSLYPGNKKTKDFLRYGQKGNQSKVQTVAQNSQFTL